MTKVTTSKLKSGELACHVGSCYYAFVPDGRRGPQVFEAYAPMKRGALGELSLADFHNHSTGRHQVRNEAEFMGHMQMLQHHLDQAAALGRASEASSRSTPWGVADNVTRFAKGINSYSTPGHGGFKVSDKLNLSISELLRNENGWYEEDGEWAKVAFSFPEHFTELERADAEHTLRNSYHEEYEQLRGVVLAEGESWSKDKVIFEERHKDDYIVISAVGSDRFPGMVETFATVGGKRTQWNGPEIEERRFLVPQAEYEIGRFGFVIDPARHQEFILEAEASSTPSMSR